jgi:hypothetical protein
MSIDQQALDELRAEVDKILSSMSPRESTALRMMLNMKLMNQTPEQQDSILRAMLQELVISKSGKQ